MLYLSFVSWNLSYHHFSAFRFWWFSIWWAIFVRRWPSLMFLSNHFLRRFNFNVSTRLLLNYNLLWRWLLLINCLRLWRWRWWWSLDLSWRLILLDWKIRLFWFNFSLLKLFSNSFCCVWTFVFFNKFLLIYSRSCNSFWFLLSHFIRIITIFSLKNLNISKK